MNGNIASVGILFTDSATHKTDKPFISNKMNRAYRLFIRKAKEKGIAMFVAHHQSYKKGGILKQAWTYRNRWEKVKNIEINFVYNRFNKALFNSYKKKKNIETLKYNMLNDVTVLNHPVLEEFCWDKSILPEVCPKNTPRTFLVNTKEGLKTVLPGIPSEKIVLKPRYGTLGEEVKVIDKKNINELEKIEKNTIVQEFIETSNGIEGINKRRHDMRIIIINGKIDHCHIRIPKKGMLTANMAKGGTKKFISYRRIPKSAIRIVKKIDKMLMNFYPRLYSIDFMFDKNQKPYIVECNSSPTIHRYFYGKYQRMSYINHFLDMVKSGIMIEVLETI